MLSFFRSYAPYQYISLMVLLGLIRLPFLLNPLPLLIPELNWMLVGEQMNQGYMLYRDIWDSVSPLSALIYRLIDTLFGRSQFIFHTAATILSVFQIMYFNYVMNVNDIYPDRNFWPGLVYTLFLNLSFDCTTLSPVLISTTFLLLAFGTLVKQMVRQGATDEVFEIGFYISLAALSYLPSALFILWAAISLLLYTGATFRQHSLSLFGFFFPFLLLLLYYYLNNGLDDLNRNLIASVFRVRQYGLSDFRTLFASLFIPLSLSVLGFLSLFQTRGRYVNFQQRCQQIMMLWFLTNVLTIVLMPYLAPMQFLSFIPAMAFFTVHYFMNARKLWLAELTFTGFFLVMLVIFYQGAFQLLPGLNIGTLSNLQVKPSALPDNIQNRKILVIGDDLSAYRYNRPATPYLNWGLAKYDLRNLDNYDAVIDVYDHFRRDPPEYIIDQQNVVDKLFLRAPALAEQYQKTGNVGVYRRVVN
ncbi:hypothetical protein [Nibrella saemangeumensis]